MSRCFAALLALPLTWLHAPGAAGDIGAPIIVGDYALRWSDNISVPLPPGYAELLPEVPDKLVVTAFEGTPLVGRNAVYMYSLKGCQGDCLQKLPGSERINWPNVVTGLNQSVFGFPALVVGDGFLVPSHTTGGVWVLEAASDPARLPSPVKVTADKAGRMPDSGWFYHLATPRDMDGDGRLDLVTARSQYGVWPWSAKRGELLWLQQPASDPLGGQPWAEHRLVGGPDFLFCELPGAEPLALAAAEYIGERVAFYYFRNGTMQSRVLDGAAGPGFSCSWADLDGDGRFELLVTNHVNQNGSVYAYAFDGDDFVTASVVRHVLATGFGAVSTKQGTAGPGDALAFQPSAHRRGKPYILVSGDNGNCFYILVPRSEASGDFSYAVHKVADLGADVGRPAIGDTDGDGFADVYVPAYDNHKVVHYKFADARFRAELVV